MKKYIWLLILAVFAVKSFAQVEDTPLLVGKYFGNQSGGGAGYWQVSGNFTDESGFYDATNIAVGDVLFFSDSGKGYHLPIDTVISASGASFVVRVLNSGITGVAGVPNGAGAIYRPTTTKSLFPYTSGLTSADQQTLNNYLIEKIEAISGGGITTLTGDVTASGSGSVAATIANNAVTSAKVASQTLDSTDLKNRGTTLLKLAQSGATNGQVPKFNSTTGSWEAGNDVGGSTTLENNTPHYQYNNIRRIQSSLDSARNAKKPLNITVLGDSKTDANLFPNIVAQNFKSVASQYFSTVQDGTGFLSAKGGGYGITGLTGYAAGNWLLRDANTTPKGAGIDGFSIQSQASSTSYSFRTTNTTFSKLDVYYTGKGAGGGTFQVTINGSAQTAVNTALTTGFQKVTYTLAGSGLQETILITQTAFGSTGVEILGFNLYTDAAVKIHIAGQSGMATQNFIDIDSTYQAEGLKALNNSMTIVYLGTNDHRYGVDPAIYKTRLKRLIRRIKLATPKKDIIIIAAEDYDSTRWSAQPYPAVLYAEKCKEIAIEDTVACLDLTQLFGKRYREFAQNILPDGLHESTGAGYAIAQQVFFPVFGNLPLAFVKTLYNSDGSLGNNTTRVITGPSSNIQWNGLQNMRWYQNTSSSPGASLTATAAAITWAGLNRGLNDDYTVTGFRYFKFGSTFLLDETDSWIQGGQIRLKGFANGIYGLIADTYAPIIIQSTGTQANQWFQTMYATNAPTNFRMWNFVGKNSSANNRIATGYWHKADGSRYNGFLIGDSCKVITNGRMLLGGALTTDQAESAQLQVNSTTRGFLLPRMPTSNMNAIASPATRLLVVDTDDNALKSYSGSAWETHFSGLKGNATLSFGTIPPGGTATLTVPVTGAATTDSGVSFNYQNTDIPGVHYSAKITATNTVTITCTNLSGSSQTPTSGTCYVTVIK